MTPVPESKPIPAPRSAVRSVVAPHELRRKIHARLIEKIDPVRTRFKPLSLVRQEARRVIDSYLDQECPTLTRSDRDRLVEDILAEGVGYGLLEELFRDETVKEIQILGPEQILARKGDAWQPVPVRFRDLEQLRQTLTRYGEIGDSLIAGAGLVGGVDVRLVNGFRVIGILPVEGSDQAPVLWLTRGVPGGPPTETSTRSATPLLNRLKPGDSTTVPVGLTQVDSGVIADVTGSMSQANRPTASLSGRMTPAMPGTSSSRMPGMSGPASGRMPAPPQAEIQTAYARDRQRITERMITKLAAAGIFDLASVPLPELRRFVLAAVQEYSVSENLGFGVPLQERLALEILAAMNR